MSTQPIPRNGLERLVDLLALEILHTPPKERFDRITAARSVCSACRSR